MIFQTAGIGHMKLEVQCNWPEIPLHDIANCISGNEYYNLNTKCKKEPGVNRLSYDNLCFLHQH